MTLLELLVILVKKTELTKRQRADAEQLLRELKLINAFGTAVQEVHAVHECESRWVDATRSWDGTLIEYGYYRCKFCERKLDV